MLVIYIPFKEIGAYIAAEGNHLAAPVEDVHLRIRAPDPSRPSRLHAPTSAVSVRPRLNRLLLNRDNDFSSFGKWSMTTIRF